MLYTIGFSGHNAKDFFLKLRDNEVKLILDVRLFNVSQLSGFAKRDDLKFFLSELCTCEYKHILKLAPTKSLLDDYKANRIDWNEYEKQFYTLMKERDVAKKVSVKDLDNACLLCSENTPDKCHRRLVAEYFQKEFPKLRIKHL